MACLVVHLLVSLTLYKQDNEVGRGPWHRYVLGLGNLSRRLLRYSPGIRFRVVV